MSQFLQPSEWALQSQIWTAYPSHADLWEDNLEPARAEFTALASKLSQHAKLRIFAYGLESCASAQRSFLEAGMNPISFEVVNALFGDIWFRDTAPLFVHNLKGEVEAQCYLFNGWGQKYVLEYDNDVSLKVAGLSGLKTHSNKWVLEGGSVDSDGQGTLLTTRQCLLNKNRNPNLSQSEIEKQLHLSLGAEKILWLDDGLMNDHTDGHIDNLARFVGPGHVACMSASGANDPNKAIYERTRKTLESFRDAHNQPLKVSTLASPGAVYDEDGKIMPASHMNFVISNGVVVMPTYAGMAELGSAPAQQALNSLKKIFPQHEVVGLPSEAILSGGGSFHCITQHQPVKKKVLKTV